MLFTTYTFFVLPYKHTIFGNLEYAYACIQFEPGFFNWLYLPTYGNRLCYRVHINYWSRISVGNWPLPFIKKWKNPIRRYFTHFVRNHGFSTLWWNVWCNDSTYSQFFLTNFKLENMNNFMYFELKTLFNPLYLEIKSLKSTRGV